MPKMKINVHGLVAVVIITILIVATIFSGNDWTKIIYSIVTILLYAGTVFLVTRQKEVQAEDKRLIKSRTDEFNLFRILLGAHLAAVLALLGLFLPIESLFRIVYLLVAVIAGLGVPFIVLQRGDAEVGS
jgi:hypothetical protein